MNTFEYCEVNIIITKNFTATVSVRHFGSKPVEIDSPPFDYIKELGVNGWEMINKCLIDNSQGARESYIFKRQIRNDSTL